MAIFNSYVKLPEGINPRESLLMFNDVYPLPLARISNGGYAVTGLPIWYVCFWGAGCENQWKGWETSRQSQFDLSNTSQHYESRKQLKGGTELEKDEARACFEHAGSLDN